MSHLRFPGHGAVVKFPAHHTEGQHKPGGGQGGLKIDALVLANICLAALGTHHVNVLVPKTKVKPNGKEGNHNFFCIGLIKFGQKFFKFKKKMLC